MFTNNNKAKPQDCNNYWNELLHGMCGTFNITGDYFKRSYQFKIPSSDSESIASDWNAIGGDLRKAISKADERR